MLLVHGTWSEWGADIVIEEKPSEVDGIGASGKGRPKKRLRDKGLLAEESHPWRREAERSIAQY